VLLLLMWRLLVASWRGAGSGPHLDGPRPGVPEGRPRPGLPPPLCPASRLLGGRAGVLFVAAVATATLAAAALGGLRGSAPGARPAAALGGATAACRDGCGGLGGNEGSWGRRLVREGEFLQAQGLLRLEEGGEGLAAPKVKTDVGEALVQAPDEVEDERPIGDNLAERAKVGGHPQETPAVICDGQITLGEAAELGVEVEGARLAVAEELGLHSKLGIACGDGTGGDGVSKVVGDGSEDPGLHDAVHARPIRLGGGDGGVGEDVVPEGELADDEKKLIPPASVVAGDVEDDGD